uniref:Vacuolar protein sorting-associated protein 29 n=1 Tax=Lotharella globosa TaxID=91324 RepID=A0A6V3RWQ2_9EUKA|mmetsp:Transcript_19399/g.39262  ORF Transcript_19399/g.39262 Transcript_19399/m.39262 type:complete len:205 (+) Transcript_19399:36-650(+)|eukprot:CAMPEP_0167775422 /NCGR_PEP_ID=MMETSP0111_2-20121227/2551_1 /TAXON_ID=91324 /ORGANISM="Lotharella globosa, Strain CCCM811" /LENGTH=204 /DNA_ID=CAMNT_0007665337 /DNA_START=36 /DNA_END=650 /DNA_ORIENTATION=+
MQDFGELVLVLGDLCIPNRRGKLPDEFKTLLVPGKIKHVLCTGNVCSKSMDQYLRNLVVGNASNVHIVKGDMDDNKDYPEEKVVTIGGFKIGLCHGHQLVPSAHVESLLNLQRKLDVDILITGNTHQRDIYANDKKFLINPGSVTGAPTFTGNSSVPSFILMAIKGNNVVTFVYELKFDPDTNQQKVSVSKSEFSKTDEDADKE